MATAGVGDLITRGRLRPDVLAGEVAIVTGGGGGIGFEAARSLLGLGATVVLAELDQQLSDRAAAQLSAGFGVDRVVAQPTDVGDEAGVSRLVAEVARRFGKVDVVLNNATYAPFGMAVAEAPVEAWDRSYAVNLRGPVLLARACLPGMVARRHGVFVCVSSTGGPFLAPYETLKAAQVELANSLDAELEGTGVIAFTIGPGLVPTRTATEAIAKLAPRLGLTVDEFWRLNQGAVLSAEAAGAGFAAAVAQAAGYAGQEISSTQALVDAGIEIASAPPSGADPVMEPGAGVRALPACRAVRRTFEEQAAGWRARSFFERQWMLRDFKQRVGVPVERCLELLDRLERQLEAGSPEAGRVAAPTLDRLAGFYTHLGDLARGYVKDAAVRDAQLKLTDGWRAEVDELARLL